MFQLYICDGYSWSCNTQCSMSSCCSWFTAVRQQCRLWLCAVPMAVWRLCGLYKWQLQPEPLMVRQFTVRKRILRQVSKQWRFQPEPERLYLCLFGALCPMDFTLNLIYNQYKITLAIISKIRYEYTIQYSIRKSVSICQNKMRLNLKFFRR